MIHRPPPYCPRHFSPRPAGAFFVLVLLGFFPVKSLPLFGGETGEFEKCFFRQMAFAFFYPRSWKPELNPLASFSTVIQAQKVKQNSFQFVLPPVHPDDLPKPWKWPRVVVSIWEGVPPGDESSHGSELRENGVTDFLEGWGYIENHSLVLLILQGNRVARFVFPTGFKKYRSDIFQVARSFVFLDQSELDSMEKCSSPPPPCQLFLQEARGIPRVMDGIQLSEEILMERFCARIEKDPRDFEAFRDLGIFYRQHGAPKEGARSLLLARKIRPDDFKTNYYLGLCERDKRRPAVALEYLLGAANLNGEDRQVHQEIGEILLQNKRFKEAIPHFHTAENWEKLGLCHIGMGDKSGALDQFLILRKKKSRDAMSLLVEIEKAFGTVFPSDPPFRPSPAELEREGPLVTIALLEKIDREGFQGKTRGRKQIQVRSGFLTLGNDTSRRLAKEWWEGVDPDARCLLETFVVETAVPGIFPWIGIQNPIVTSRFDQAEYDRFCGTRDRDSAWREFFKLFPSSVGIVGFSRISFNKTLDRCLVYQEYDFPGSPRSWRVIFLRKGERGWETEDLY